MPTFSYTARDRDGNASTGTTAAATLGELRESLRARDLYLTRASQVGDAARDAPAQRARVGRITLTDLVVMSRQFAVLVRSGIPIVDALHGVAAQTENRPLVTVLQAVRLDVLGGATLSEAMSRHPRVFSDLYVALAQAGEAGGALDQTLDTAADQLERESDLREKVKGAMVYPAIVVAAAVGVIAFMLLFIVPVFKNVYTQFHAELPLATRALVVVSSVVVAYGWIVLLVVAGLALWLRHYVLTPEGRARYDRFRLSVPFVGRLARKIAIARFARTLAGMMRGGVPILRALQVSANTSGNTVLIEAVFKVAQAVKEGSSLAGPLTQTGEFPPLVTQMIAAGEQSGNLDEMLEHITRFYDRDIELMVNKLTRMLEPIMTVGVGGMVLAILLALYMPVFNLANVVRR